MKPILTFLLIFAMSASVAQDNYVLEVDGKSYDITLDKEQQIQLRNKPVSVTLKLKEQQLYQDGMVAFNYPKSYNVSSTSIDGGIQQLMLMDAEGSGVIIQEYSTMNPSLINELMLSEVTKESLSYGYKLKREDYKRTLKSGQEVQVNKAVLTYNDEVNIYEIASLGKKDSGVMILSMSMDDNAASSGKKLINMIWETFEFK